MQNDFKSELNNYRRLNKNKIEDDIKAHKKATRIAISLLVIPIVFVFFYNFKILAYVIPLMLGFLMVEGILGIFFALILGSVKYAQDKSSGKIASYNKIFETTYRGDLYDIFDKDCKSTQYVLKEYKEKLSSSIYHNKGLKGSLILSMVDDIDMSFKNEVEKEEQEALINGNTKVGDLLKAVNQI